MRLKMNVQDVASSMPVKPIRVFFSRVKLRFEHFDRSWRPRSRWGTRVAPRGEVIRGELNEQSSVLYCAVRSGRKGHRREAEGHGFLRRRHFGALSRSIGYARFRIRAAHQSA